MMSETVPEIRRSNLSNVVLYLKVGDGRSTQGAQVLIVKEPFLPVSECGALVLVASRHCLTRY